MQTTRYASRVRTLAAAAILGTTALIAPTLASADGSGYHGKDHGDDYRLKDHGYGQSMHGGDQDIDQSNKAGVEQAQGNDNANVSPGIELFGAMHHSKGGYDWYDRKGHDKHNKGGEGHANKGEGYRGGDRHDDGSSSHNEQGNKNDASVVILQGNLAGQWQNAWRDQGHTDDDGAGAVESSGPYNEFDKGDSGDQPVKGGDQDIDQSNKADVEQTQGNGNINISPALSIFGDATTKNSQGNHNDANAVIGQGNLAGQWQASSQAQAADGGDAVESFGTYGKDDKGDSGDQSVKGGDQDIDQSNKADVEQKQGNGNLNISPALSIFGDASTKNSQGNENDANTLISQGNLAGQWQESSQARASDGGEGVESFGTYGEHGKDDSGDQSVKGGDQDIDQSNKAGVEQTQGNGNINISPAISLFGDASTHNSQGNGNDASATVIQGNAAGHEQSAEQRQGGLLGGLL